jgi:hypothetical protein
MSPCREVTRGNWLRPAIRKIDAVVQSHTIWTMEPAIRDARQFPRVHFFDRVRVFLEDQRIEAFGLDVSAEGMRLRSNTSLLPGSRVALEFGTHQGSVRVDEAEVVWAQPFEPINVAGSLPGFGVRFLRVGQGARDNLAGFLAGAVQIRGKAAVVASVPEAPPPEPVAVPNPVEVSTAPAEQSEPDESANPAAGLPPSMDDVHIEVDFPTPTLRSSRIGPVVSRVALAAVGLAIVFGLGVAIHGADATASPPTDFAQQTPLAPPTEARPSQGSASVPPLVLIIAPVDPQPAPALAASVEPKTAPANLVVTTADDAAENDSTEEFEAPVSPPARGPRAHTLGAMEVRPEKDAWVLVIWHRAGLKTKAFALSEPPRFVVDVFDSDAPRTETLDPGVGGVNGIRATAREGFVRYVVDFAEGKVPNSTVFRDPGAISVRFTK